jgi:hypothetical protein
VYSNGSLVATITAQDDSSGTQVAFADGSTSLKVSALGAATLGSAAIGTTAVSVSAAAVGSSFDTTTKSGSTSLGGTTSTNQTFTLTTGLNNLAGGTGNDFFDASANLTLNSFDTLDGSTGTDTLFATLSNVTVSPSISGVEALQLSSANGASILDLAAASGYTSIENTGSTTALTVQNLSSTTPTLKLSNTSASTVFAWQAAAVSGSADSVTLTLSNVTMPSAAFITIPSTVETTAIVSSTAANTVYLGSANGAGTGVGSATITVSGSQALTTESHSATVRMKSCIGQ